MTEQSKEQKIVESINLVFDSLESHLPYTYREIEKYALKRGETHAFHKKCVREYALIIKTLSDLL